MRLVEFLLARIAEDDVWAREASRHRDQPLVDGGEHWRWECRDDEIVKPDTDREFMECSHQDWSMSLRSIEQYPYRSIPGEGPSIHLSLESELSPAVAGHVARHDPARVLAECEAKRRIVNMGRSSCGDADEPKGWRENFIAKAGWEPPHHYPEGYASGCDGCSAAETADLYHDRILRFLALPYADHPDYREEWRP